MNPNYYTLYWLNSKLDVAVSQEQYAEIKEVLIDQYLSREMMMNFKNLSRIVQNSNLYFPIFMAPIASYVTFGLFGFNKTGGANKAFMPIFVFNFFFALWYAYTRPLPRRLYTKILADPTSDGQYIRTQIATMKPGLWQILSRELYRKGYLFPEMNEFDEGTEFQKDFVPPY